MATDQPVGNAGFITEMDVRIWMRDRDPEANLLLKDLEFTPEEIRTAWTLAVDFWNEEPPNLRCANYTLYTFPWRGQMLSATAANLLFIAANRFRRNKLRVNIPGGAADDQAKDQDYEMAGTRLWDAYKDWVRRKKRELNMLRGWGMV